MTFAFDEQFTMFDVTPVENQFILEQLPGARGDYVKVYLYGLMCCYHPREEVTLETIGRELNMTPEEIMAAYRYWERHGAVRRISDHPPEWKYISFKQRIMTQEEYADPDYVTFSREVERAFDGVRVFHGNEMAAIYEWKEGMQLPTEVILMVLSHMLRTRGKNFRITDAEKLAARMAAEDARTEDEAADVLARDEAANTGMRKVMRLMGMRGMPSKANLELYGKWTGEWGFTQEAIEEACGQTGKSEPSIALVDAILKKTYEKNRDISVQKGLKAADVRASTKLHENLKQVMRELGRNGSVTSYQEEIYGHMLDLYPQEIILIAAKECGRKKKDPESLLQLLQSWHERGFTTEEEIDRHISAFRDRETFMKKIRSRWCGRDTDTGEHGMEMLVKWEEKLGFSRDLILLAADYAAEARRPMNYLDALLNRYADKGIRTTREAEQDHREYAAQYREIAKKIDAAKVPAQRYQQRDYSGEQQAARERMMNWNSEEDDA